MALSERLKVLATAATRRDIVNPTSLMLYILYGFIVLWGVAWLYAFERIASDALAGMINSTFTLKGLGWSAFCALMGLVPLFFIALVWSDFLGVLP